MVITILTLFPDMFQGPFDFSIIKRAIEQKIVTLNLVNLRDFALDKYKSVDDHPYGGGTGMVLRVDVVDRALNSIKNSLPNLKTTTILLDPKGVLYNQKKAVELSQLESLILIAGRYEGIDDRINTLVDQKISIGDYIVTGGEIPAMAIVDSVVRILPGVLKDCATAVESFSQGLLEYPQYTKPLVYHKIKVPEILLSGNHAKIQKWRQNKSKLVTKLLRPDLLKKT